MENGCVHHTKPNHTAPNRPSPTHDCMTAHASAPSGMVFTCKQGETCGDALCGVAGVGVACAMMCG
jgi:hypothetical protein